VGWSKQDENTPLAAKLKLAVPKVHSSEALRVFHMPMWIVEGSHLRTFQPMLMETFLQNCRIVSYGRRKQRKQRQEKPLLASALCYCIAAAEQDKTVFLPHDGGKTIRFRSASPAEMSD
jgi:hypothetical protein